MVSGWDKRPGPHNDYTPMVTTRQWIAIGVIMVIVVLGLSLLMLWAG